MKTPLIICQLWDPPVIRNALYKSKLKHEYEEAFNWVFQIMNELILENSASAPYLKNPNFIDFCLIHFTIPKIIELSQDMDIEDSERTEWLISLRK